MSCPGVPQEELARRRRFIQESMELHDMEGLLAVHPPDAEYLCGFRGTKAAYLPSAGEAVVAEAGQGEAGCDPAALPEHLLERAGVRPGSLGVSLDVMPVDALQRVRKALPGVTILDSSGLLLGARAVKSDWELDRMEETAALTALVFEFAADNIRAGETEIVFSGRMEARAGELGLGSRVRVRDRRTEGYPWHVLAGGSGGAVGVLDAPASGEGTSAAFPCGAGYRVISRGEPVMVDFAVEHRGYHMDETRIFVLGDLPVEAERAWEATLEIHDRIMEAARPGVTGDRLFRLSVAAAGELGYTEQYLGPPGNKVKFVGHGIGLELVEPPFIAEGKHEPLASGMTMALEPKMVFRDRFAVGVESVCAVTETGCRLISRVPLRVFRA